MPGEAQLLEVWAIKIVVFDQGTYSQEGNFLDWCRHRKQ